MNYLYLLLLCIIAFQSCSSGSKKTIVGQNSPIEERLGEIDNKKFQTKRTVQYNPRTDFFDGSEVSGVMTESLKFWDSSDVDDLAESSIPLKSGAALCQQQKFAEAKNYFRSIYQEYKKHPSYWNQIGVCYIRQGNYPNAILYLNKARALDNSHTPSINNLGVIYAFEGERQKALSAFLKASSSSRKNYVPKYNLAQVYLSYGFYKKAESFIRQIRSGVENDNRYVEALSGVLELAKKNPEKSVTIFENLPESISRNSYYGLNYAIALILINQKDDAREVLQELNKSNSIQWKNDYQTVLKMLN